MERTSMQLMALESWEFKSGLRAYEWTKTIDDLYIVWDTHHQMGAYIIDDELTLIHNWDELEDLMEQVL